MQFPVILEPIFAGNGTLIGQGSLFTRVQILIVDEGIKELSVCFLGATVEAVHLETDFM